MIIFENEGLLDVLAITTMGVSVKDDNAIGYFGTGLKYGIAVLLRSQCEVDIYIDGKKYFFSTVFKTIREKEFEIVTMNGQELGFTTDLGKNWECWQAFRELACNAMDEGGKYRSSKPVKPRNLKGRTVITVRGEAIEEAFKSSKDIFFQGKKTDSITCEVINKPSEYLFYRGVRVYKLDRPSLLTYNIKSNQALTEDRTLLNFWDARMAISRWLAEEAKDTLVHTALRAGDSNFEYQLDYDYESIKPSEQFMKVAGNLVANKSFVNKSASNKYKLIADIEEELISVELNEIQQAQMDRAIVFLKRMEPNIQSYKIVCMESIGEGVLGRALPQEMQILLSLQVFDQGTKQVATTILEEYYHLRHGFADKTYAFQTYLFDRIMSLNEELVGEPI